MLVYNAGFQSNMLMHKLDILLYKYFEPNNNKYYTT